MPYTFKRDPSAFEPPSLREIHLEQENRRLQADLRAFVAIAVQHGLRNYCENRHPDLLQELEDGIERSEERTEIKYARILAALTKVPELRAVRGDTEERTYYMTAEENVAYVEHSLKNRRFILSGIWVAPAWRGQGIAHRILRRLLDAADDAEIGVTLYHEPFGEPGLQKDELEAFYGRHGFHRHVSAPDGLYRYPCSPLDMHLRPD